MNTLIATFAPILCVITLGYYNILHVNFTLLSLFLYGSILRYIFYV